MRPRWTPRKHCSAQPPQTPLSVTARPSGPVVRDRRSGLLPTPGTLVRARMVRCTAPSRKPFRSSPRAVVTYEPPINPRLWPPLSGLGPALAGYNSFRKPRPVLRPSQPASTIFTSSPARGRLLAVAGWSVEHLDDVRRQVSAARRNLRAATGPHRVVEPQPGQPFVDDPRSPQSIGRARTLASLHSSAAGYAVDDRSRVPSWARAPLLAQTAREGAGQVNAVVVSCAWPSRKMTFYQAHHRHRIEEMQPDEARRIGRVGWPMRCDSGSTRCSTP